MSSKEQNDINSKLAPGSDDSEQKENSFTKRNRNDLNKKEEKSNLNESEPH